LRRAIRLLIAVVRDREGWEGAFRAPNFPCRPSRSVDGAKAEGGNELPATASECLAWSYAFQSSATRLEEARCAAAHAVSLAPHFALALIRLAELEFSFGEVKIARRRVEEGLALAPESATARVLDGFLLAASYRPAEAFRAFEQAIEIDPGLPTAWLGRGLMKIRAGAREAGLRDLQTAAAVDPGQALLRSYLGKAYADLGRAVPGRKEFDRALSLDPEDPTPWLYSALLRY